MESALYEKLSEPISHNGFYESLSEPIFSDHAIEVLKKRYLGQGETPKDRLYSVATQIAGAERQYGMPEENVEGLTRDFYEMMAQLQFLPNSPTLRGGGRGLQLSACYVLPVKDSMESIFDTIKQTALIHKAGGGTGYDWSELRPYGASISSTGGHSKGPLSFMEIINVIGRIVEQGGARQGANMGVLRVTHPDILKFIRSKSMPDEMSQSIIEYFKEATGLDDNSNYVRTLEDVLVSYTQLKNFNISVGVTEEWMELAKEGKEYDLINHRNEVTGRLNAKEVLEEVIEAAWKKGDPGIMFLDRMNRDNPTPELGTIVATNPCGEQPLLPFESCNLGSINLARMLKGKEIDYELLGKTVETAVRFLDDVIDVNPYPVREVEEMTKGNRKIGLGVMGFADMLVQLGIPYTSEEGVTKAEEVMKFINEKAYEVSCELAEIKGAFPNFEKSIYANKQKIRNAARTTIAPTGTLSLLCGVSSGVEPQFRLIYKRESVHDDVGKPKVVQEVTHPYLEGILKEKTADYKEIMKQVRTEGTIQTIDGVPEDVKRLFLTANEIDLEWHVRMQSAFQKHVDNAVSKTINFGANATKEDVAKAYWRAYELGLKGITVYRDMSKGKQVLTSIQVKKEEKSIETMLKDHPESEKILSMIREKTGGKSLDEFLDEHPIRGRKIPGVHWLPGATYQAETGCGPFFITINSDKHGVVELFANMNPPGGCSDSQTAGSGILSSGFFHCNGKPEYIIKHFASIHCPNTNKLLKKMSCSEAISMALKMYKDMQQSLSEKYQDNYVERFFEVAQGLNGSNGKNNNKEAVVPTHMVSNRDGRNLVDAMCPDCGATLQFGEGCRGGKCETYGCGYSSC